MYYPAGSVQTEKGVGIMWTKAISSTVTVQGTSVVVALTAPAGMTTMAVITVMSPETDVEMPISGRLAGYREVQSAMESSLTGKFFRRS